MDRPRGRDEAADPTLRAFFALVPPASVLAAAAQLGAALCERPGGDRVRWVRFESLHVTLRFLGEIAGARVASLVQRVAFETRRIAPLRLRLASARIFPSPRRARVVALGIEPVAPLAALAEAVERGVVAAGFAPEPRRFHAHLTLGRIPARATFPDVTAADTPDADAFDVNEVFLLRSDIRPDGARYTRLERVPLRSRDAPVA